MAQYGYNAPGYTGYKRGQEPYPTYDYTGSYGGSRYPDQYASKPVQTTYVVEEEVRVHEIRRATDSGYQQPGTNMNVQPQKIREYVTRVSNHPLPTSTNHRYGCDEPTGYGSSTWKNHGGTNDGYGDYSSYGSNRPIRDRDVAPLNDIRDVIEAAREPKDQLSPNSSVRAGTYHHSQEYDRGYGGYNSSTRPYAPTTREYPKTSLYATNKY